MISYFQFLQYHCKYVFNLFKKKKNNNYNDNLVMYVCVKNETKSLIWVLITQICPCYIQQYFMAVKMVIFRWKNEIFFFFLLKT